LKEINDEDHSWRTDMQKITPFLWFDDKAEEAAYFYASIFKNAKVGKITRYREETSKAAGRPAGYVRSVVFNSTARRVSR